MNTARIAFATLLAAGGLIPAAYALYLLFRNARMVARSVKAEATVVAYETVQHAAVTYYYPVVEFINTYGTKKRVRTPTGSSPERFPIGRTVPIYYREGQSAQVEIAMGVRLWFLPAMILAASLLPLGLALWYVDWHQL